MVARCLSLASSLSNAEVTESGIDPHHLGFNGNMNEERAKLEVTEELVFLTTYRIGYASRLSITLA